MLRPKSGLLPPLVVTGLVVVGVAVLQVCVFGPAFRLPFIGDDFSYLNRVQTGGWSSSGVVWDMRSPLFRPGLDLAFAGLHAVFGSRPTVFHVVGAALVLAAAGMVGLVARRLGLRAGAIAAAIVYALHASMATSIGWASAVNSPLAIALALGSVYLLLPRKVAPVSAGASCILFALALMTREVVSVVPLMLAVALLCSEAGGWKARTRRALRASAPLWGVLVAYVVTRRLAGYELPTTGPYAQSVGLHALRNFGRLSELATDLAPAREGIHRPVVVIVFWLVLVGASLAIRRTRPQGCIGLLWFFVGVLPVIFLATRPMSFYYVDLALVGVALTVGTLFEAVASALSRRRVALFAVGCLALLVVVSHDTAQQQLKARLYAYADTTTEFVRRFERDNPRPRPGGSIVVWYQGPAPGFITAGGDLFRVRYRDPALHVNQIRATGVVPALVRLRAAGSVGVVLAPHRGIDPVWAVGLAAVQCTPAQPPECMQHALSAMVPTARDPSLLTAVPTRHDGFAAAVHGVSARRLFVLLGVLCFGALALSFVGGRRGRAGRQTTR